MALHFFFPNIYVSKLLKESLIEPLRDSLYFPSLDRQIEVDPVDRQLTARGLVNLLYTF